MVRRGGQPSPAALEQEYKTNYWEFVYGMLLVKYEEFKEF